MEHLIDYELTTEIADKVFGGSNSHGNDEGGPPNGF